MKLIDISNLRDFQIQFLIATDQRFGRERERERSFLVKVLELHTEEKNKAEIEKLIFFDSILFDEEDISPTFAAKKKKGRAKKKRAKKSKKRGERTRSGRVLEEFTVINPKSETFPAALSF